MFDEIMVLKEEGGKRIYGVILDEREVRGRYGEEIQGEPAGQVVQLSISHDGEYATAVCLARTSRVRCECVLGRVRVGIND